MQCEVVGLLESDSILLCSLGIGHGASQCVQVAGAIAGVLWWVPKGCGFPHAQCSRRLTVHGLRWECHWFDMQCKPVSSCLGQEERPLVCAHVHFRIGGAWRHQDEWILLGVVGANWLLTRVVLSIVVHGMQVSVGFVEFLKCHGLTIQQTLCLES